MLRFSSNILIKVIWATARQNAQNPSTAQESVIQAVVISDKPNVTNGRLTAVANLLVASSILKKEWQDEFCKKEFQGYLK